MVGAVVMVSVKHTYVFLGYDSVRCSDLSVFVFVKSYVSFWSSSSSGCT